MEEQFKKRKQLPILLILLAIIIVVGFVFWWMTQREVVTNANGNVNKILNLPEDTTPPAQSSDPEASMRDSDRLHDIRTLRQALKKYYDEQKGYPEEIDELITGEQLESIPVNPQPGGKDYNYTPTDPTPYQSYQLCYSLEMGIEGVSKGEHCATPDSLTGQKQEEPDWDAIINKRTNN